MITYLNTGSRLDFDKTRCIDRVVSKRCNPRHGRDRLQWKADMSLVGDYSQWPERHCFGYNGKFEGCRKLPDFRCVCLEADGQSVSYDGKRQSRCFFVIDRGLAYGETVQQKWGR